MGIKENDEEMGTFIDLKGQKFNEWTAIEYLGKRMWLCSCSCRKTTKPVSSYDLRKGSSKSCGKCKKIDISIGDKFGKWIVIDNKKYNNCKSNKVICKCSCGNTTKEIVVLDLKNGKTKKCLYCSMYKLEKGMKINEWTIMEDGFKLHDDKVLCSCSCGRTIENRFVFDIMKGNSKMCVTCSRELPSALHTHEDYLNQLKDMNINIEVNENYIGSGKEINHTCPICKRTDWKAKPSNILNGMSMCSDCSVKIIESKHASILKQIWKYYSPNVSCEDISCINPNTKCAMPTDIVDHDLKVSVEIQSRYHERDKMKIKDEIKKQFWISKGYKHYQVDIREYSILEMVQLFFSNIKEIPKWVDLRYKVDKRDWSLKEAQKYLDDGYNMKDVSKLMNINIQKIYFAVFKGHLVKPDGYEKPKPKITWDLVKAQELLNQGYNINRTSEEIGVAFDTIKKAIKKGLLIKY